MTGGKVSWADTQDPQACNTNPEVYEQFSRDPTRTPFQWSSAMHAGFSTALRTWLPVNSEYTTVNVALQEQAEKSHLKVFKALTKLRKTAAFTDGIYQSAQNVDDDTYAYLRGDDKEVYIVVLNFAQTAKKLNLMGNFRAVSKHGNVVVSSINTDFNAK